MPEETPTPTNQPEKTNGTSDETEIAVLIPQAPSGLAEAESLAVQAQANKLATEAISEAGSRAVLRKFDNLGRAEQESIGSKMGFLEARVGTLLKDVDGDDQPVPKNLLELRMKLDELNPQKTAKQKVFGLFPKKIRTALNEISAKYGTVKGEIDNVLNALNIGSEQLREDNAELETLLLHVEKAKADVVLKAYLGELIIQRIEEQLATETDEGRIARLKKLLHRTYMRVQDMRVMEQVNWQFDASVSQTIDNNDTLIDTIDRVRAVARPLLAITLSLSVALQRQKSVVKSTQAIQESMGDMLQGNAKSMREQGAEINRMANEPVLGLAKIQESYEDVMATLDEADKARELGITQARITTTAVRDMSSSLSTKVEAYRSKNPLPALEDEAA
jgi:uncharacterized protein YaaN involved in tellurite resistance